MKKGRQENPTDTGVDHVTAPRLFVREALVEDGVIRLTDTQSHYLRNVLRKKPGSVIRVFNGSDGEWIARLGDGRGGTLSIDGCVRLQDTVDGPWLLFPPLKKDATDFLIQKAVELGCARLLPVLTSRTQTRTIRMDRFEAQVVEAAEQCERLDVPSIEPLQTLSHALEGLDNNRTLFLARERSTETVDVKRAFCEHKADKVVFLIGPEGGLSEGDIQIAMDFGARSIHLGPRILRAETAACALLSVWQACVGDWKTPCC